MFLGALGIGKLGFGERMMVKAMKALAQKQAWRPFPFPEFNPTQPDPSKFREVGVFLEEETAVTFEAWLAGLAEGGDTEPFVKATEGLGEAQIELVSASQAAGVAECADAHK